MEVFDIAFNKSSVYETIFFNIQSVTEYRTFRDLENAEPKKAHEWRKIASTKYRVELSNEDAVDASYGSKAVLYPEFSKIIAITHAQVKAEGGKLVREMHKKIGEELDIIRRFRNYLLQVSAEGAQSTPVYFPTLCGYNIINNDIPLFIKRIYKYRDQFEGDLIPYILKKYLKDKPWDTNIVDLHNLWRMNGMLPVPLSAICQFLDLKINVEEIMSPADLSALYWGMSISTQEDAVETVALQSANITNLSIQILNELRKS